jgi:formylglycine-generating enzyme required for sulfatase activity
MVAIPAGSYTPLYASASKVTAVPVGAFALDRVPVTRDAFAAFTRSHPEWRRDGQSVGQEPIVDVSWRAAKAYCEAHGKRLPTTAEWERVASADAGDVLALYAARSAATPAPVGKSRPNALGIANLHDLIWEWTLDFDGAPAIHSGHSHDSASHSPPAHVSCASAAIGASSTTNYAAFLRAALRATLTPTSTLRTLGFRCAASLSV